MPQQQVKRVLGGDLNRFKQYAKAHKDDPIDDNRNWPGGIEDGIARIAEARFEIIPKGRANEGKKRLYLMAVLVEPEEKEGVRLAGRQHRKYLSLAATKSKSYDDAMHTALDELTKLCPGWVDTFDGDPEQACAFIAGPDNPTPFFRFTTRPGTPSKEFPNPRTWVDFNGIQGLEDYQAPDADSQVVDQPPSTNGEAVAEETQEEQVKEQQEQGSEDLSQVDLEALVEVASQEYPPDEDPPADVLAAMDELRRRALEAGVTEEEFDAIEAPDENTSAWQAVADAIIAKSAESGEAAEPVAEPPVKPAAKAPVKPTTPAKPATAAKPPAAKKWEPVKGAACRYQRLDPKTKKPEINARKMPVYIDCKIEAVNVAKKTADLKNVTDGKTLYKGVKLESLLPSS